MSNTTLFMGNELAALGAARAGVTVATGYPGTPSTEALEYLAKHFGQQMHVEWSVNETALEVAAGASYAGARTFVTMKQVGLNVASDPLMSLRYVGLSGGMVVYVADDPGPISSQTEQDTRSFAAFAKVPVFDPSSPEEAFAMMADAYALSEQLGSPVFLRPTTRICHANAAADPDSVPQQTVQPAGFRACGQRIIFPRTSYLAHLRIEDECERLSETLSSSPWNFIQNAGAGKLGIAAGGVSYAYAMEAMSLLGVACPVLKISTPFPFPERLAEEFLSQVDQVLVFEELDPVIERNLIYLCGKRGLNVRVLGKGTRTLPRAGEYSVEIAKAAMAQFLGLAAPCTDMRLPQPPALPVRPPVLCAGCPHRGLFYVLKKLKLTVCGDIGCYTLGSAQPLCAIDTTICMGASVSGIHGFTMARGEEATKSTVAVIGDSTFMHSGITGLVNIAYNGSNATVIVLDNSITGMTGHQQNPSTGLTLKNQPAPAIRIEDICRAAGIQRVRVVDPQDMAAMEQAVQEELAAHQPSVIISRRPCAMLKCVKPKPALSVNPNLCRGCKKCMKLGCPAIVFENGRARIDETLCVGCGLCPQMCAFGAIGREDA